MKISTRILLVLILVTLVSGFYIQLPVFFVGGDWNLPLTQLQFINYLNNSSFFWKNSALFTGSVDFLANALLVVKAIGFLGLLLGPYLYQVLVLGLFLFGFISMYYFLIYLRNNFVSAFFGALFFVFNPLTFNYLLMGWIYVLLALFMIPVISTLVLKYIRTGHRVYLFLLFFCGIVALAQSQIVFIYPLLVIALMLNFRLSYVIRRSVGFLVPIVLVILFNLFWLIPMMFFRNTNVSSEIVSSSVSEGTLGNTNTMNLLRVWGSLVNYQFESSYPNWLGFISYIPLLFFALSMFQKQGRGYEKTMLFLLIIPFLFYMLPRNILVHIPYSGVIRDINRFSLLAVFSLSWGASNFIEGLLSIKKRVSSLNFLVLCFTVIFLLYSLPFWSGDLKGFYSRAFDFRIRNYNFPNDAYEVDALLRNATTESKRVSLPGASYGLLNDYRFKGPGKELFDPFFSYTNVPGNLYFTDRDQGTGEDVLRVLYTSVKEKNATKFLKLLQYLGGEYITIRRFTWPNGLSLYDFEKKLMTSLVPIYTGPNYSLLRTQSFYPELYGSDHVVISNRSFNVLTTELGDIKGPLYEFKGEKDPYHEYPDGMSYYKYVFTPIYFPEANNTLTWDTQKWSWPITSINPSESRYSLVKYREFFERRVNRTSEEDLILWQAAKRISEIDLYSLDVSASSAPLTQFEVDINKLIESLRKNLPYKNQKAYRDFARRVLMYTNRALIVLTDQGYPGDQLEPVEHLVNQLFDLVRNYYDYCDGVCYNIDVEKPGMYKVFLGAPLLRSDSTLSYDIFSLEGGFIESTGKFTYSDTSGGYIGNLELKSQKSRLLIQEKQGTNLASLAEWRGFNDWTLENNIRFNENNFPTLGKINSNIWFSEIEEWKELQEYKISFDYEIKEGKLGVIIVNNVPDLQSLKYSINENSVEKKLSEELYTPRTILSTNLGAGTEDLSVYNIDLNRPPSIDSNSYKNHFETNFRAEEFSRDAKVFVYTIPNDEGYSNVSLSNFVISPVVNWEIVLESSLTGYSDDPVQLSYEKISPTSYFVNVGSQNAVKFLVLNQSYHDSWNLYALDDKHDWIFCNLRVFDEMCRKEIPSHHFKANGYANAWYIADSNLSGKQFVVEFTPQRLYKYGIPISVFVFFGSFFCYLAARRKSCQEGGSVDD